MEARPRLPRPSGASSEASLGPALPRNWYLIARSGEVTGKRVISRSFLDRDVVVFRDMGSGRLVALDGACRHMGCHLRHGEVTPQGLRCALHHRVVHPDGRLVGGMGEARAVIAQPLFPVVERHGGVFVYRGEGHPPPLPEPGFGPAQWVYAGEHRFPLSWQALVANGFDAEHLSAVHHRDLLAPPTFEELPGRCARLNYLSRPSGGGLSDRITNWLAPQGVEGRISSFSGTLMLVESTVGARRNALLLSFLPDAGGVTVRGLVGQAEGRSPMLTKLTLAAARLLFMAFLRKDLRVMEDLRWREPRSHGGLGDDFTRRLCDYFRSLPDVC